MRHKKHSGGSNNRNRGRGKFRSGSGGGGGGHDSQSLARQKKHAQTQKEKYMNLAREAQVNGERVDAEYYFQHVEHYSRVLAEIAEKEPKHERNFDNDIEGEDEAEASGDDIAQMHTDGSDADADLSEESASQHEQRSAQSQEPRQQRPRRRTQMERKPRSSEEIPLPLSVLPEVDGGFDKAASAQ